MQASTLVFLRYVRLFPAVCLITNVASKDREGYCCPCVSDAHVVSKSTWWWLRSPGVVWVVCEIILQIHTESCPVSWGHRQRQMLSLSYGEHAQCRWLHPWWHSLGTPWERFWSPHRSGQRYASHLHVEPVSWLLAWWFLGYCPWAPFCVSWLLLFLQQALMCQKWLS